MNFVYPNLEIYYIKDQNILTFLGFKINVGDSNIIINFEDVEKILTDNVKVGDTCILELKDIPKIKEAYEKWNPKPQL